MITKTKWIIDPVHSTLGFKVKHMMITNVNGVFNEYEASIYTTGDDFLTAEIDLWINPASIDTKSKDRDAHLKGADFFDAANFKEISFRANSFESVDKDGSYELYGDLTIKGITKRIKLDIEFGGVLRDPWGNEKAGFIVHGIINRKDWGLNWNSTLEAGGVLVGEDIKLSGELQLMKSDEERTN